VNAAGARPAARRIPGCLHNGTRAGPANRSLLARNQGMTGSWTERDDARIFPSPHVGAYPLPIVS